MTVFWTNNAKRELRAVYDYIAQNSARYAQGLVDRITRKTKQLSTMPYLGATVPEYEEETIREMAPGCFPRGSWKWLLRCSFCIS